jgi:pyruvate formate lyase activating enzyme
MTSFFVLFKHARFRHFPGSILLFRIEKINDFHYQLPMPTNSSPSGVIFAIKRYALHDGPDLRVTVFLKGCPLSCLWCHNPEGIAATPGMLTVPGKCVGCGECVKVCVQGALSSGPDGICRNQEACTACGVCAEVCPALAHEAVGRKWTVPEVMAEIEKETPFFAGSQGGVTFSGGEPLAQPDFLEALLMACKSLDLHRAVDTSGLASAETVSRVARHTDLFLFDIKHMDPAAHRRLTGVDNALILSNLRLLTQCGAQVALRLPLIPGMNDDEANIRSTGLLAASLPGIRSIDVLPYHASARGKYAKLGLPYPGESIKQSDPDNVDRAVDILQHCGLEVRIGG